MTASFSLNSGGGGTTLTTGSTYPITSSWANNVITASYALVAGSGGGSTPAVSVASLNNQTILYNFSSSQEATITGLTTCRVTKGVYKVAVNSFIPTTIPCVFYDLWRGLYVNGVAITDVENEFVVLERGGNYTIGTSTQTPKLYGFSFDGIKQNEKILNTDFLIAITALVI